MYITPSMSSSFSSSFLTKGFIFLSASLLLSHNPFSLIQSSSSSSSSASFISSSFFSLTLVEAKSKLYNCEEVYFMGIAAMSTYSDYYSTCISSSENKVCQYMEAIEQSVIGYLAEQDCSTNFACTSTNSTSDIYKMCNCEDMTADDDVDFTNYLDDDTADDDDSFTVSSTDDGVVVAGSDDSSVTTSSSSSDTITVSTEEWFLLALFFVIIGALIGVGGFSCGALCFSCLFGKKDRKRRDYIDQDPMMNRVKTFMDSGATTGGSLGVGGGVIGGVGAVGGVGVIGGVGGGKEGDENENKGYYDESQDDEDAPPANIYDQDDGDENQNTNYGRNI